MPKAADHESFHHSRAASRSRGPRYDAYGVTFLFFLSFTTASFGVLHVCDETTDVLVHHNWHERQMIGRCKLIVLSNQDDKVQRSMQAEEAALLAVDMAAAERRIRSSLDTHISELRQQIESEQRVELSEHIRLQVGLNDPLPCLFNACWTFHMASTRILSCHLLG